MKQIEKGNLLIFEGTYGKAKALLSAIKRRCSKQTPLLPKNASLRDAWRQFRAQKRKESKVQSSLLVKVDANQDLQGLKRPPPQVATVLKATIDSSEDEGTFPPATEYLIPLQELLGRNGFYQRLQKGYYIPQIDQHIFPSRFGVFPPTRPDYLDLLAEAPLPETDCSNERLTVFDIGIGTGVLSAVLLHRHSDAIGAVVGTDINPAAITCARENLTRLGYTSGRVHLECTQTVFPNNDNHPKADLIVCNPPWLPANDHVDPDGPDASVYDLSNLLETFIKGAKHRLKNEHHSEIWLLNSDLAELLELRHQNCIEKLAQDAGLYLVERLSTNSSVEAEGKEKDNDPTSMVQAVRRKSKVILYRMMAVL